MATHFINSETPRVGAYYENGTVKMFRNSYPYRAKTVEMLERIPRRVSLHKSKHYGTGNPFYRTVWELRERIRVMG